MKNLEEEGEKGNIYIYIYIYIGEDKDRKETCGWEKESK
jgi:hypothetical protein